MTEQKEKSILISKELSSEYQLILNNINYNLFLSKNKDKKIILRLLEELIVYNEKEAPFYFQSEYSLNELIETNKIFKLCDSIIDAYDIFVDILKANKVFLKESECNKTMTFIMEISLPGGKTQQIEFELKRKQMTKDEYISELIKKIKNLENEVQELKSYYKDINNNRVTNNNVNIEKLKFNNLNRNITIGNSNMFTFPTANNTSSNERYSRRSNQNEEKCYNPKSTYQSIITSKEYFRDNVLSTKILKDTNNFSPKIDYFNDNDNYNTVKTLAYKNKKQKTNEVVPKQLHKIFSNPEDELTISKEKSFFDNESFIPNNKAKGKKIRNNSYTKGELNKNSITSKSTIIGPKKMNKKTRISNSAKKSSLDLFFDKTKNQPKSKYKPETEPNEIIYIKNDLNKLTMVGVSKYSTVQNLIDKYCRKKCIPSERKALFYQGKQLDNDQTLGNLKIPLESTLYILYIPRKINVLIRCLSGEEIWMIVDEFQNILQIKGKISDSKGIPVSKQIVLMNKKVLNDELRIKDIIKKDENELHLLVRTLNH